MVGVARVVSYLLYTCGRKGNESPRSMHSAPEGRNHHLLQATVQCCTTDQVRSNPSDPPEVAGSPEDNIDNPEVISTSDIILNILAHLRRDFDLLRYLVR